MPETPAAVLRTALRTLGASTAGSALTRIPAAKVEKFCQLQTLADSMWMREGRRPIHQGGFDAPGNRR